MRRRLSRHMSAGDVESLNAAASATPSIVLDLTDFTRARLFTEGRLLGFFTQAERQGTKVTIARATFRRKNRHMPATHARVGTATQAARPARAD